MDARELQQTFAKSAKQVGSKALIRSMFDAIAMPQKLRSRYYTALERSTAADADTAFREAFPSFPVVIKIGSPSLGKKLTRLDRLWGTEGSKIIEAFEEVLAQVPEEAELLPVAQLYKLPYMKEPMVLHNAAAPRYKGIHVILPYADGKMLVLQSVRDLNLSMGKSIDHYILDAQSDATLL